MRTQSNRRLLTMNQVLTVHLAEATTPNHTAGAKGPSLDDQLVELQFINALSAIISSFAKIQSEAAKEDAEQTDKMVAEGQSAAEAQATQGASAQGHSGAAGAAAATAGATGGLGAGAA